MPYLFGKNKGKKINKIFNILFIFVFLFVNFFGFKINTAYAVDTCVATGGTITYSGGYTIHTFTTSGTLSVTAGCNVEVLVVGGGGSASTSTGAAASTGGGGAGGYVYNSSFAVNAGSIAVTVGNGATVDNNDAQNSVFSSITAYAGGSGTKDGIGHDGASGAGSGGANKVKGNAIYGTQGSNGGLGYGTYGANDTNGGGGGGSSAVGAPGTSLGGGAGGAGTNNSISGVAVTYANGGSGGKTRRCNNAVAGAANTGDGANAADGGYWPQTCIPVGAAGGSGVVIVKYLTATVPDAPTGLTGTYGDTQASLSWTVPVYYGNFAITDYVVEYKLSSNPTWSIFSDGVSTITSTIVTGLTNGASYDFRVSAVNAIGQGSASSTATIFIGSPRYARAAGGNWSADATWSTTSGGPANTVAPTATDYVIFDANSGNVTVDVTTAVAKNLNMTGSVGTLTITNAMKLSVSGSVTLTAGKFSSGGTTAELAMLATGTLTSAGNSLGKLTFNGTSQTFTLGDPILSTGVFTMTAGTFNAGTNNITASNFSITAGTLNMGSGIWKATSTASGSMWTNNSGAVVNCNTSTLEFSGDSTSVTRNFSPANVVAFNNITISGKSTTPAQFNLPNNFTVNGIFSVAAPNRIKVGSGRTITLGPSASFSSNGTLGSLIDWNVISGTTPWNFSKASGTVIANYNSITYSTASGGANFFATNSTNGGNNSGWVFASAPGTPTNLTPTASNNQVSLSWTASADGGTAITDYVIDYKLTSEPTVWSTFADGTSANTTATVTGLTNGLPYDFRVSAVNVIGQGTASSTISATPATVPGAPSFISAPYTSWGYRSKITIDHTKVPNTNQSYFPVLINRTDVNWKDTSNSGHVGQSDGGDIFFTSSDGTTKLDHEIEKYTPSTGELIAWVEVPTLTTGTDTELYMYYGNASVADQWNITGTWDGGGANVYKGVWHLPNGTSLTANDSTINANNGTIYSSTASAGKVDGSVTFSGSDSSYVDMGNASSLIPASSVTLSAWIKTTGTTQWIANMWNDTTDSGQRYAMYVANGKLGGAVNATSQGDNGIAGVATVNDGNWHYVVLTAVNGTNSEILFVDGNLDKQQTPSGTLFSTNGTPNKLLLARTNSNNSGNQLNGSIDEVRVSTGIIRSADWIKTEYNNQNSPTTFSTVSTEETIPAISATAGNAQATISFNPPVSNGGSVITSYTVTSNPESITATGSASPITVTGLTNGSSYTFTVTATNAMGTGSASIASNSVTPATIPDAPTALSLTYGNAQVSLSWNAPVWNGGSDITDYVVEYKLTSEPTVWSTFADGTSTATAAIVTGLTNGTSYDFKISAVNTVGQGTASSTASATPATVPGAPTSVTAVRGNGQATISFSVPASNGGSVITSYTVTSSPENKIGTGATLPIIVTGLTNGSSYTFTVTATNIAGTGTSSLESNSVTPATIPDAPTSPIATAENAQVLLSWTAPVWNGGSAIIDYVIEYKLSADSSWSTFADGTSAGTTATVTGLANGSSYDFRISSVNDVGQGSPSAETNAMPITTPDAPTGITAVAGNAQATISFTPPIFNGGSTINSYVVTSTPGNFTATGGASPLTVTGLTNGTTYTFTVSAVNVVGTGTASAPSNSIVPVTVPDAPTAVSAVEGNTEATISFTPPVFNGGTAITSYTVTSSPGNFTATGGTSPLTVTGLANGNTYTFTVIATNIVGDSPASSTSNSVTLSTEPSAPVNLAATVLGSSIGLSWSAPTSSGGTAITDYVIEYQLTTGGTWAVFAEGVNTNTTATVTGLSNGNSYDFRIKAVNIIGQSVPSATVSATPGEPAQVLIQSFSDLTVPSIGTNIRITNEGSSPYEYQYAWCVTDSDINVCGGGDDIFSSTAAKLINAGANFDTTLNSTVLVPGNYYFHVKVLYGSQSSSASQSFTALATFPDPPTSPLATVGNGQATVSFTVPAFDGGSAITSYTVTSSPGGITGVGVSSPITVTGLTNGSSYTFTVTATNIMGTSLASTPSLEVTPVTVPDVPTNVQAVAGNAQVSLSWTAPLNNGGTPITDYIVEYKLSTDSTWVIFADGISVTVSAVVTGLANGFSYDFRISAVNAVGQSSVNSSNGTSPIAPAVPPPVVVQRGGGGGGALIINQQNQIPTPAEIVPTPTERNQTPTENNQTQIKNVVDKNTIKTGGGKIDVKNNTSGTTNDGQNNIPEQKTEKNEAHATPTEEPKETIFPEIKIIKQNQIPIKIIIISGISLSFLLGIILFIIKRRGRKEVENVLSEIDLPENAGNIIEKLQKDINKNQKRRI